jgi:hypothetical protein
MKTPSLQAPRLRGSNNAQSIMNEPAPPPERPAYALRLATLAGLLLVGVYSYLYWFEPLPAPWNDQTINVIVLLTANLAAVLGTRVWQQFLPGDRPRQMWLSFSLGLWSWGLGEIVWLAVHTWWPDQGDVNIIDFFWAIAYVFWIVALFFQYRLIQMRDLKAGLRWLAAMGISVLGITLLITIIARSRGVGQDRTWFGTYLTIFYPVGDLLLGLAALDLSRRFGGGLWGRPWWGLIIFAISDGITGWYYLGGYQLLTAKTDAWLSLFTDVLYFGAYVIFAVACYSQYLLLRYGPPVESPQAANELVKLPL